MRYFVSLFFILIYSCGDAPLPKPKGYLRLDYPIAEYKEIKTPLPFIFEKNTFSDSIKSLKTQGKTLGFDINYSKLKGTIYISYKAINNNLDSLLLDAQNLTQKHTIKADEISSNLFENNNAKVYGIFYEVGGDAASQAQFYATDSTKHFLSGSLYFYTKPNYDSIYPASEYLKKDMRHLMETLEWTD